MSPGMIVLVVGLGLAIGTISGMVGIGGGLLVVPILMLCFSFSQAKATGTSLALLLPPVGIFAVITYARMGNIDWLMAGLLAVGFVAGGWLGAWLVNKEIIPPGVLRVFLALLMVYVGGNLLFRSGGKARMAMESILLVVSLATIYGVFRFFGHRWQAKIPQAPETYRQKLGQSSPWHYDI